MDLQIESKLKDLDTLCIKYGVRKLELFGSATSKERFAPTHSDLDFLVEFKDLPPGKYADAYFGLLEDLQTLFNRPIDLVMTKAIKNRYFLEAIQSSRILLYAA